jgi:hypothetical protein
MFEILLDDGGTSARTEFNIIHLDVLMDTK